MAVYTKVGDQGETGLWGGKRVSKGDWVVNVIGQVDELNSHLGLAGAMMESVRKYQISRQRNGQANIKNQNNGALPAQAGSGGFIGADRIEIGLASLIGQLRDVQRELFEMGTVLAKSNIKYQKSKISIRQAQDGQIKNQIDDREGAKKLERMAEEFVGGAGSQDHKTTDPQDLRIRESQDHNILNTQYQILDTSLLERLIDEMEMDLPRLMNFILPGGGVIGAQLMVARAVCRRAEREAARYFEREEKYMRKKNPKSEILNPKQTSASAKATADRLNSKSKVQSNSTMKQLNNEAILRYLNRLSDYLFVASRWVNWLMEEEETVWRRNF